MFFAVCICGCHFGSSYGIVNTAFICCLTVPAYETWLPHWGSVKVQLNPVTTSAYPHGWHLSHFTNGIVFPQVFVQLQKPANVKA